MWAVETLGRIFLKLIMRVPKTDMPAWSRWNKRLEIPTQTLHKYLHLGSTEQCYTSFNCKMWFFVVGFMSIKFFHHATKLNICRTQAAEAPAVRWSSCATTVKAELLDRFLWWKEPILTSCPFRGFSYVRIKPRNGQLTKMVSFHQSKRSDNKWYTVEVSWGIFIENLA